MPRILFLIPTLDRAGPEKQLTLLACGLKARGWDVHVGCLSHVGPYREPLEAAGVPVTILGRPWKLDPFAWFRWRRFIAQLKPDLVHTWLPAANTFGRAAALSAGVKHVVASERGFDASKRLHQRHVDRYLMRRTERITSNSAGLVEVCARHGLPKEKFAVIPNGVAPFDPQGQVERQELLQELDLPEHAVLIGTVGRLWPHKRHKDLVWAADLVQCVHSEVYLLVIGEGPQRWRLERYASQVTAGRPIRFLGQRDDVPRLLPHLACFWHGSAFEGQPNAVLEAMAAGLPVVASDIPGHRDLVVDGETGYLVRLGDRAGFASRTSQLLKDPELRQQLGAAAKQRAAEHFSIAQMVDGYEQLYRSLFGQLALPATQ